MKWRERFLRRMPEGKILELSDREWELVRHVAHEGIANAWRQGQPVDAPDAYLLANEGKILFFHKGKGIDHFMGRLAAYTENTDAQVAQLAVGLYGDIPDPMLHELMGERAKNAEGVQALTDNIAHSQRWIQTGKQLVKADQ
ncbi:MAG TPA: hypothetical protein VHD60_01555 [Candidatus Saccharimonadales bacterium]|nr:hypothetical protein [Candidatus Saccharimonadales bacterium]